MQNNSVPLQFIDQGFSLMPFNKLFLKPAFCRNEDPGAVSCEITGEFEETDLIS